MIYPPECVVYSHLLTGSMYNNTIYILWIAITMDTFKLTLFNLRLMAMPYKKLTNKNNEKFKI